jgi:hypothetical protein
MVGWNTDSSFFVNFLFILLADVLLATSMAPMDPVRILVTVSQMLVWFLTFQASLDMASSEGIDCLQATSLSL